jgi:hypothetical protein
VNRPGRGSRGGYCRPLSPEEEPSGLSCGRRSQPGVRIWTDWLLHRHNFGNDTACALSYCHRCRVYRTRLFLLSHTLAPPRTAGPFCVSYAMQKKSPTMRRGKVCSLGGTSPGYQGDRGLQ